MITRAGVIQTYFELCKSVDAAFDMDLIDSMEAACIKERYNERAEALLAALPKPEKVGAPR